MEAKLKNSIKCVLGISIILFCYVLYLSKYMSYIVLLANAFIILGVISFKIISFKNEQLISSLAKFLTITAFVLLGMIYISAHEYNSLSKFKFHAQLANFFQSEEDRKELIRAQKDKLIYQKLLEAKKHSKNIQNDITVLEK